MEMELSSAVAIVTGGGTGIGRAIALELAGHGARVVLAGRRSEPLHDVVNEITNAGGQALAVPTDVTDDAEAARLVEQTVDHFGQLDVLVNNAGRFNTIGAVWEVDPDDWWLDVTANLRGTMLCARHAIKAMIPRGSGLVINMRGGDRIPGGTGYSCSKVAVTRFTELLAKELEMEQTGVLCVSMGPGFVHTDMTELQAVSEAGRRWLPGARTALEAGHHRPPEDCARATAALIQHADPLLNGGEFGPDTDFADALTRARAAADKT